MARPTKLTYEKMTLALELRKGGFSLDDIARLLGVERTTLYKCPNWEALRNELNYIKEVKEQEETDKIINSLHKLAKFHTLKTKTIYKDAQGNITQIVEKAEQKQPNEKAIEYYLNNKRPEEFKAVPVADQTADVDDSLIIKVIDGDQTE